MSRRLVTRRYTLIRLCYVVGIAGVLLGLMLHHWTRTVVLGVGAAMVWTVIGIPLTLAAAGGWLAWKRLRRRRRSDPPPRLAEK